MSRPADQSSRWYAAQFEAFEKGLNGEASSRIHAIRKAAMERFAAMGFPDTSEEEWRFTSVEPIARTEFLPAPPAGDGTQPAPLAEHLIPEMSGPRLVFLNGSLSGNLSLADPRRDGAVIRNLTEVIGADESLAREHLTRVAPFTDEPFTALNTGFLRNGAMIVVPEDTSVPEPIYLVYLSSELQQPFVSHPRTLILAGRGSRATVVEHYVGLAENSYFTNAVTEIVAGEGSAVEHIRIQTESPNAYHIGSTSAALDAGSRFISASVSLGGSLVRNNVTAVMRGEGIECTLNGLALATGRQHVDNHTTIDHAKPHCESHELYKTILDGSAHGVFNGKIYVRRDAQKTDAKQTNKTLLLSDGATMNTKPQLEIFADDVKCTHGAAIGYLDAEAIFYLRSRGLDAGHARDLLTYAFAGDVAQRISVKAVRDHLGRLLARRLRQARSFEEL